MAIGWCRVYGGVYSGHRWERPASPCRVEPGSPGLLVPAVTAFAPCWADYLEFRGFFPWGSEVAVFGASGR